MNEWTLKENLGTRIGFAEAEGKEIEIRGMVQNLRVMAWGAFLILRAPGYSIQAVIDSSKTGALPADLKVESAVRVKGTVKKASIKDKSINPRDFELQVTGIEVISSPTLEALPVDTTKKEMSVSLDTKFDLRPLTLRHPRERAIFKIASTICLEFENSLSALGFTKINTPKIVFSGAEGGANIFKIGYFDREAFLTQSPQFYKQIMVGVFGRVFEIGPVFRAEKHDTSRHLNEYISLDLEMGFIDGFMDIIQVEANFLRSIIEKLRSDCAAELELFDAALPSLDRIVTVRFKEVHDIVYEKFGKDYRQEEDLAPEEERFIGDYAKSEWNTDFVFVTHYPTGKRPFYAMDDPEDPSVTLSFDLLFRGIEITTGGQRLYKYDDYVAKMRRRGMNPDSFEPYLQTFKYGMPPHGGLGLGLERLTAMICGLSNVKEASLFPRDINRLTP